MTDTALIFKMPRATISTIVRNKEAIKAASAAKGVKSVSKQHSQTLEEVEKLVYNKINEKQRVTAFLRQSFARNLGNCMLIC